MSQAITGSCLCSEVRYQVDAIAPTAAHCHCTMCRKFHGAAFATLVPSQNFRWVSGIECVREYTAENGTIRSFCRRCGSSLGFRSKGTPVDQMEVAIATLDQDIQITPEAHIFTNYKANWFQLSDDVAHHREGKS
ncbi:MAG: GFA family protein [Gammaproteobacteria bacterium]|nr:GFA family protein [Gammaproteobacteria bacterium]